MADVLKLLSLIILAAISAGFLDYAIVNFSDLSQVSIWVKAGIVIPFVWSGYILDRLDFVDKVIKKIVR